MSQPPKYHCDKCGAVCLATVKPAQGYDSQTGKPNRPDYRLRCPNYRWYNFGHFNEEVSQNAGGYWFYYADEFGPFGLGEDE